MFEKLSNWFWAKRKPISYTIAVLNILVAVMYLMMGHVGLAILWTVISMMFIYDALTLD